jgi:hypothetical protein
MPSPGGPWCPVSVGWRELDGAHTRYALTFRSFDTGRASGTVALFAGDKRYEVPFNTVALDTRDITTPETPVVVRFAAPTPLDGAVVTSLDEGGVARSCDPWFSPWVARAPLSSARTPDEQKRVDQFLATARAAVPVDAPNAVADPLTCTTPYRAGRTTHPGEAQTPYPVEPVMALVLVVLDTADHVLFVRTERTTKHPALDASALNAARESTFEGQIFRCRHVVGAYLFGVSFGSK